VALEVNQHVVRLRRYQPFHPESSDLIYEMTDPDEATYTMKAEAFLNSCIADPSVSLIVLTGDAGHGKTSLSAAALRNLGMEGTEAMEAVANYGDAAAPVSQTPDGRSVWLFSDLSSVEDQATEVLQRMLHLADGGVAIVCANEGHLRAAVARDTTGRLATITQTLEDGIQTGSVTSASASIVVLNLNYQSVAPEQGGGLVDWALKAWVTDKRRWSICGRCDARGDCPILANHIALSDATAGQQRVAAFRDLLATVEKSGQVITTRQALALVAHAITGGLSCRDVHRLRGPSGDDSSWQHRHLYHQALFGGNLTREQRRQVAPFPALRRLDPAEVALRFVDDRLDLDAMDEHFLPPRPSTDGATPHSRRDAQRESNVVRNLIAHLRRRAYFDAPANERMERMGLRAGRWFAEICNSSSEVPVAIRDTLLRGLEAAQGVYRPANVPDFLVLDPAFSSNRSRAAVIARHLRSRNIKIVSQAEQWRLASESDPTLPQAVDWANRSVTVRINTNDGTVCLDLSLMTFELLVRWAEGLSSRVQHESEIRRIAGSLSSLVRMDDSDEDIDVLVGGEKRTLTIDVGDLIRSGGA